MAMIQSEVEQCLVKLSFRSKLSNLQSEIENRLKEPYLTRFKESCFSYLLDVSGGIRFQGQLVAQLLFCQNELPSVDKLVFNVQGQQVDFSPEDFAIITGLCFGSYQALPYRSLVYDHVFGDNSSGIKFDDIESKFKHFSELEHEGETCFKLALLYVVYGVLLCQSHSKKVDEKYIHLVDGLERFNDYPWGRVAFEFLIFRTHRCMKDRLLKRKEKKTDQFDVNGFIQVLQVWAYEVLPRVGEICAVKDAVNNKPRLLWWKSGEAKPKAEELRRKCFLRLAPGDEGLAIPVLQPTMFESRTKYYKSVHKWRDELKKSAVEGPSDVERRKGKKKVVEEERKGKRKLVEEERETANDMIVKACAQVDKLVQEVAEQGRLLMWLLQKHGYPGDVNVPVHSPANDSADSSTHRQPLREKKKAPCVKKEPYTDPLTKRRGRRLFSRWTQ